jgi:L-ascorbate metabolism protein UlaG (beta-lactamase superfamily)
MVYLLYILLAICILPVLLWLFSIRPAPPVRYLPMNKNKTYCAPEGWKGMAVDRKNRFMNTHHPYYQDYLAILRWMPGHLVNSWRNRNYRFPVQPLHPEQLPQGNFLVWLGHASFYLCINGRRLLIDPQFYRAAVYKRHSDNPAGPQAFRNIDYILLSHDHADHCDPRSLAQLTAHNPQAVVLTGLGMETCLAPMVSRETKIVTAEWYEQYPVTGLHIWFVPSRHYCKRVNNRFNRQLWGGFVIRYTTQQGTRRTIYFAGDSGYDADFATIGALFRPDIALLGIGAYLPGWFMHPNHMSPKDALQAFRDTGAAVMIPMHYGTYNLSCENMDAPLRELNSHAVPGVRPLQPGELFTLE